MREKNEGDIDIWIEENINGVEKAVISNACLLFIDMAFANRRINNTYNVEKKTGTNKRILLMEIPDISDKALVKI